MTSLVVYETIEAGGEKGTELAGKFTDDSWPSQRRDDRIVMVQLLRFRHGDWTMRSLIESSSVSEVIVSLSCRG